MKKKVITFFLLLLIVGVLFLIGHEVGRRVHHAEQKEETATDAQIDYSLYYTYGEVEHMVNYLSDTPAESETLSRLIDPLKKSQPIDVRFVKDVSAAIGVKDMVYADVLTGKKDNDFVTKEEFETFYENVASAAVVKGLLRQDLLVLKLDEEDKTSFFDGHETYHAEIPLKESYEGSILDVYMKNGKIFKVNGLGDSKITLSGVWVKAVEDRSCTFLYGNLEDTCVLREDADCTDTPGYVADLVFDYAGICEIKKQTDIRRGHVISAGEGSLQVEDAGTFALADDYKIYNIYEGLTEEKSLQLLTGYSNVDLYLQGGTVSTIVIDEELKSENIRVILSNDDGSYAMQQVSLTGTSAFTVTYPDAQTKQFAKGETVTFDAAAYESDDVLTVTPDVHSGRIRLLSLTRECGNPAYGGNIELRMSGQESAFYVINELSLEHYLFNVVANAMPSDYPAAALSAMAVCARGTAYAKMKDESYAEYHADLDDTSLCQVYNNVSETDASIQAVKETYGIVPTYRGTLIVPMTFNTSYGMTCTNADIWGGDAYSYLESNVEDIKKDKLDLSKEDDFKAFLNDCSEYDMIDKDSPYFRWSIAFSKDEMTEACKNALEERKELMTDAIEIENADGKFTAGEIPDIGTVEKIEVSSRLASGVVETLIIRGSEHTISVSGQSNIRAILNPVHQEIVRQDGSTVTGWTSLPSPYYYVENTETGFVVHGGGFGHGAGMSIYGAGVLGRQGKNYKYILRHYFSYIDFASIYTIDDQDSGETTQTEQE